MILLVRSFWGGLLIMIPNILPIALALGVMGLCGWTLDIAGVLTTSVALGIAVDDTLHFTCWYINDRKSSDSAEQSVASAFHGCSAAMIHTTLICSCSMFPFLFADFIPTQQFAILMISILVLAVLADLILLPALLLSPAGRVIAAKRK
jgi:predicted RND superfamily exporter protein